MGDEIRRLHNEYLALGSVRRAAKYDRRAFHAADKKRACQMSIDDPQMTHQQIADILGVKRPSISKILMDKQRWLPTEHQEGYAFARVSRLRFHRIEERLRPWVHEHIKLGAHITDDMIREQAIFHATNLGLRGKADKFFHCGRTWLRNSQARFGIVGGVVTGDGHTKVDVLRAKALGLRHIYYSNQRDYTVDMLIAALPDLLEDDGDASPDSNESVDAQSNFPSLFDAELSTYSADDLGLQGNRRVTFSVSSSRDEHNMRLESTRLMHNGTQSISTYRDVGLYDERHDLFSMTETRDDLRAHGREQEMSTGLISSTLLHNAAI